jgi:cell division protein ZapE
VKGEPQTIAAHLAHEVAAGRLEFDAAQQGAALRLDALALALKADRPPPRLWPRTALAAPRGVYLWGSVGRGKTYLMDLFYESLRFEKRERAHFYRFMQTVHRELRAAPHRKAPLEDVAKAFSERARVICLDEFLVLDIADAMILGALLESLVRRRVVVVATSNRAPQDLYKDGLQRERFLPAIRLLERRFDIVELSGSADYRQRHLETALTYWDSDEPGSDSELRALFRAYARGSSTGPATLEVEERPIEALDSSSNAVWFEFRELCETARAANDYLEIARRYRAVVVSNVPIFTAASDDAARRFLILVDALYDRGAILVLSAAAEPEELYQGERLQFDFQRAASRLAEMRSHSYLDAHGRD